MIIEDPMTDQPFVDRWPLFDEGLSKIPAPVDIEAARLKLARRFNSRIPTKVGRTAALKPQKREV
jgi:hypothetical protein